MSLVERVSLKKFIKNKIKTTNISPSSDLKIIIIV